MKVVLGIDLGTSYFKAGIVNRAGFLLGLGRTAVPVDMTRKPFWEVPVNSFWKALKKIIEDACTRAGVTVTDICAVSYSSQANSFLLLDSESLPLTPLILWPDTRGKEKDSVLEELWAGKDYLETAGMSFHGQQMCIAKIRWFQKNEPDLWARTRHIMTISDYFSYILTGEIMGDSGTASLLGIYNLKGMKWWSEALSFINIPEEFLSRLLRPGTVEGSLGSSATEYLGLKSGIAFSLGGLDHHIAALGAGAGLIADTSESTGTVLACYHSPVAYQPDSLSCLGPSLKEGEYYRLRFNDNGGRGIEWYRENFAPRYSLPELDEMAAKIEPGSDGLYALPEVFLEKDLSRFIHCKDSHGHGHYIRAVLESTAVSLMDLLSGFSFEQEIEKILATGGGAGSSLWLKIKADITGIEFITTTSSEPAAYGASMLAAVAAGWFHSCEEAARSWVRIKQVYKPDKDSHRTYGRWLVQYRQYSRPGPKRETL